MKRQYVTREGFANLGNPESYVTERYSNAIAVRTRINGLETIGILRDPSQIKQNSQED